MRSITSIMDTFTVQSFATYRFERNPVFFQTCPNIPCSLFQLPPILSIVPTDSLKLNFKHRLQNPLATKKEKRKKEKKKRIPSHFRFKSFRRVLASHENFSSSTIVRVRNKCARRKEKKDAFPFPEEIRVVNFFKIPRFESRISNLESRAMKRGAEKRKWENGTKRKTPRSITFLIETEFLENARNDSREYNQRIRRKEYESVKITCVCVCVCMRNREREKRER